MTDAITTARVAHAAARAHAGDAAEAHSALSRRLEAANAEVADLTSQIERWDPDDARGMSTIVSARDLAAGRCEALHARATAAKGELAAAEEAETEAARAVKAAELAAADARIAEITAELDREALDAHHRFTARIEELRETLTAALDADRALRPEHYSTGNPPGPGYWTIDNAPFRIPGRGCPWWGTGIGDPLAVASRRVAELTRGS